MQLWHKRAQNKLRRLPTTWTVSTSNTLIHSFSPGYDVMPGVLDTEEAPSGRVAGGGWPECLDVADGVDEDGGSVGVDGEGAARASGAAGTRGQAARAAAARWLARPSHERG